MQKQQRWVELISTASAFRATTGTMQGLQGYARLHTQIRLGASSLTPPTALLCAKSEPASYEIVQKVSTCSQPLTIFFPPADVKMCQDLMHIIGPFHWIPPRGGVKVDLEEQKRNTGGNLQNADTGYQESWSAKQRRAWLVGVAGSDLAAMITAPGSTLSSWDHRI